MTKNHFILAVVLALGVFILFFAVANRAEAQTIRNNQLLGTPTATGLYYSNGIGTSTPTATGSPMVGTITGTSTTASSTLPRLNVTTALQIAGEYISNFTSYVRGLFSGSSGIAYNSGTGAFTLNASIEDLNDVAAMTENYGDLLFWNGTTWTDIATSSLGLPSSIGPAGQLQTGSTITMASSTGSFNGLTIGITITASGNTITYTPSLSGTLGVGGGGTGLSSTPTYGQLLVGNGSGYTLTATSSLGIAISDTTGTLAVSRGGTGATTLSGILQGNGTSAVTAITGTAGQTLYYNGSNTATATSTLTVDTTSNVGIGSTTPQRKLSVGGAIVSTECDLTDGATITFNLGLCNQGRVTLTDNRTLDITNHTQALGQPVRLVVCQDGTGSKTLTWDSAIRWKSGTAPTLTTTANKCDVLAGFTTAGTSTPVVLLDYSQGF